MRNNFKFLLPVLLAGYLLHPVRIHAQMEYGLLNIRNYTPNEYGAHPQNFCFAQDERGVMFIGNNRGVLEYDGYHWNLHKTRNESAVTAMFGDRQNTLLVGGINEIGKLQPDKEGALSYSSLVQKLPEAHRSFDKILKIHAIGEKRIFQSHSHLLIFEKNSVSVLTPGEMGVSYFVQGKIYFNISDSGLHVFDGVNIRMVAGGSAFRDHRIFGILEMDGHLLVCTGSEIYLQQGDVFEKQARTFSNINTVKPLGNQYLAFGLFGDGLVITDQQFETKYVFGLNNGLQDGTVNSVFLDRENNLWVALNRGIDKLEIFSPINLFNFNVGLKGGVEAVIRHKQQLYVATYNGAYYFDRAVQRFHQLDDMTVDCYGMTEFITGTDTLLFLAAVDGVYQVHGTRAELFRSGAPWNVFQSKSYSNRLFVGEDDGLSSYVYINGQWKNEPRIAGVNEPVSSLVEDDKYIWVGSRSSGLFRITAKTFTHEKPEWKKYGEKEGLPAGWTYVCSYRDKLLFGTSMGLYEYDETRDRFFRSELNPEFSKKPFGVHTISEDGEGRLWLSLYYEKDNTYDICYLNGNRWEYKPFLKYNSDIVQTIYLEKKQAWMGTAFGLMRYDYSGFLQYNQPFQVVFTHIHSGNESVFRGFFGQDHASTKARVLSYAGNNLDFEFSAASFSDEAATQYRYFLSGHSQRWSSWQSVPNASFTNLGEGEYIMMVKARNTYGVESAVATYRFTILPPWHRTWWAYTLYVLFFIAFVYMAVRLSTRGLKRIIQERTAEVVAQKELVEEKNRDILDSIKYAKRIQEAMIPGKEIMQQSITRELFVFYRPKDIVSGDFYWMRNTSEGVLIAAVDCTGHGVPGAFVSIIGNNGLNRAVNEFGLRTPGKVLDKLTELTEEAFRQQGNAEVKDGMDCSLCLLNLDRHELHYAGANNPLWIVRSSDSGKPELIEYKADKQPIGRFDGRKPFTTHKITLQPGDCVYLFSDGYADQFGGPGGKKFKYKQLKDILMDIYPKPMAEQEKIIVHSFDQWRGEYEQLDDVCLIGFRA